MSDLVYQKPPIIEAVIELRFSSAFDAKSLALELQSKLGNDFAAALHPVDQIEVETSFGRGGFATSARKKVKTWFIRLADERSIVGCGEGVLSLHEVAPYRGWSALRALFDRLVALVPEPVAQAPLAFVGVRYIDRIVLPKEPVALDEYFTALPKAPMSSSVSTFHWSCTTEPDQDGTEAALTIASVQAEPDGRPAVVLDLTLHQRFLAALTLASGALVPILDRLHTSHRCVFEASITEKTRELFR